MLQLFFVVVAVAVVAFVVVVVAFVVVVVAVVVVVVVAFVVVIFVEAPQSSSEKHFIRVENVKIGSQSLRHC